MAIDEKAGKPSTAERLGALESWRKSVLRGLLTVAAIVAPVIIASALVLSDPLGWKETAILVTAGVAFPALRLVPGLPDVTRAALLVGLMFASGVATLASFGFIAGPGIVLMVAGVLAVLFLGRARAFVFIGLSVAAVFVVGACFRVVQESLTDALRHAAPRRIRVRAVRRPTSLWFSIIDDGCGFDTAALSAPADRLGVVGMHERIRARGGTLRIDSRRGAGTTVDVELPTEH